MIPFRTVWAMEPSWFFQANGSHVVISAYPGLSDTSAETVETTMKLSNPQARRARDFVCDSLE
jgi:hypothetical protein